jgi:hypothetical protein
MNFISRYPHEQPNFSVANWAWYRQQVQAYMGVWLVLVTSLSLPRMI